VWLWLAGAILAEVTATLSLRFSDGFSRLLPAALVVVFYGASFYCLSRALIRGMPLGVAYGVWAAAGVTLIALLGVAVLGERLTPEQVVGVVLVIAGVLALELGRADHV
jgi:small multidrug resistance pump